MTQTIIDAARMLAGLALRLFISETWSNDQLDSLNDSPHRQRFGRSDEHQKVTLFGQIYQATEFR